MKAMDGLVRSAAFDIREATPSQREIVGMITTNTVDRYGEIVDPLGGLLEQYRKNPVVLLNHITWGLPVGKNIWIKSDGNGLLAKTRFADTNEGADVFRLYDEGYMKAWSIGFMPLKWNDSDISGGYRRRFTQWELLEYSAVTIPANPEAVSCALSIVESPRIREELEKDTNLKDDTLDMLHKHIAEQSIVITELRQSINTLDFAIKCMSRLST